MILFFVLVFLALFFIIGNKLPGGKPKNFDLENKSTQTQYNPATGLPMIGGLDSMGNSIGSSASDRNNNWNNDYRHSNNSSRYDSFNNRY